MAYTGELILADLASLSAEGHPSRYQAYVLQAFLLSTPPLFVLAIFNGLLPYLSRHLTP